MITLPVRHLTDLGWKFFHHVLIVGVLTNAEHVKVFLSPDTLDILQLFRGDTVEVNGRRRKSTVLVVLSDDELSREEVGMNKVAQKNLRVSLGDVISVHPCAEIKYVSA